MNLWFINCIYSLSTLNDTEMSILGEVAKTRVKDMAFVQRMKNRQRMQLGMKANKFQPHFRCQVMFWRSCSKGHLWRSFVIHVLSSIFQSFIHVTWSYKSILCIWCRHRAFGVGGSCPPPTFVAQQIIEVKIRKWTV